jgi:hypothetical protein
MFVRLRDDLDADDFTADSWEVFETALDAASDAVAALTEHGEEETSDDALDAARAAVAKLLDGVSALEFADPPEPEDNHNVGRIDYDDDEKPRPSAPSGGGTSATPTPTPTPIPSAVPDTTAESADAITAETISEVYGDVLETSWYASDVAFVTAQGLMKGKGDTGTFAPEDATTRAEWVTILARLEDAPAANENSSPWYQAVWDWATAEGLTDGANPTASITREQLVTILWRYAGEPDAYVGGGVPDAPQSSGYTDSAQISDWARDAVAWAIERGILQGDANGLRPRDDVKRSEVAAILRRYIEG